MQQFLRLNRAYQKLIHLDQTREPSAGLFERCLHTSSIYHFGIEHQGCNNCIASGSVHKRKKFSKVKVRHRSTILILAMTRLAHFLLDTLSENSRNIEKGGAIPC